MPLSRPIVEDRIPSYERAPEHANVLLRALDATEHNMERLNALARGSGRTYHTLIVEGPLLRASLERALDVLVSRHPLLRVRIVRGDDGRLFFAPTLGERADGSAHVPLTYALVDELGTWPELVEADMNAGAIASGSGPLFAVAMIAPRQLADGAGGRRAIVLISHHSVSDATSCVALLHELLEQLASPRAVETLPDHPLSDPFRLERALPQLVELEQRVGRVLADRDGDHTAELERLHAELAQLEQALWAEREQAGELPVALKSVHGWLGALEAKHKPAAGLEPEAVLEPGFARYAHARTAFLHRTLTAEITEALLREGKTRGLTLHGALGAAVLFALAAERATAATSERLALASAVNLRKQLVPALAPHEVRMAIDIHVSRTRVEPGAGFWELARRFGGEVTHAVASGRALSSYFRTPHRDFAEPPPGVALPLLSNVGRVELATHYGPLSVRELSAAMTTHGSFQLVLLSLTFDRRLSLSFYCETPTVSRATLERVAGAVIAILEAVARGEEPAVASASSGTRRS